MCVCVCGFSSHLKQLMSNCNVPKLVCVKLCWTYIYVISSRGISVMFNITLMKGLTAICYKSARVATDHILMIIVTGFLMRSKLWFSILCVRVDVFRRLVSQNRSRNWGVGGLRLR